MSGYLRGAAFVALPSRGLADRSVSVCCWAVLSAVCAHASAEGAAWPSVGTLAALSGCGESAGKAALRQLRNSRYLTVEARRTRYGRDRSNLFRITAPRDFAAPRGALEDPEVTPAAWRVLCALASRADAAGKLTWPAKLLARHLHASPRSVRDALRLLAEAGWLHVRRPAGGQRYGRLQLRLVARAVPSIDDRDIGEVNDDNGNGPTPTDGYTLERIVDDGCFLSREVLDMILGRLRSRKNLIQQGPPGTGKTWLAKRLAFALLGEEDQGRVRRLQFHPNLSYEDFVRGYRPVEGRLELTDGPFLKVMDEARSDPDCDYVVVIEEINRGNPAQIFGEMLTLLEADKRTAEQALALAFPRDEQERVHVPPNLYLIGTMNVADRSLALVDLALRRRFAFVDLEPVFGAPWRRWMRNQGGFDDSFLQQVANRMDALNAEISADTGLGAQFRVGHSYLTVPPDTQIDDPREWYREVVETEIAPLLREYWFDQTDKADARKKALLADF